MTHQRSTRKRVLSLVIVMAGVSTGQADEVTYWNDVALDLAQKAASSPPHVGRDLAIVHSAVYDALMAIDGTHSPLYYEAPVMGPVSREAAVAAAAHEALTGLFPGYEAPLNDLLSARLANIPDGAAENNGLALGRDVAANMLGLRASDGWDRHVAYPGGAAPGQWRPTPPGYLPALAPQWGDVRPFAIPHTDDFLPGPCPPITSAEYAAAVNEVKSLGAADSATRTPDQTEIAVFWDDPAGAAATPVGKWNQIAQVLAGQQGNTLAENARLFALLNLAEADAGIVAWDTKYTYGLWRPEDAIHLADTDGNPLTQPDPDWTPLLTTPPFPEYTSGHSTFQGAGAEMLALFFGTDDLALEIEAGFGVLPGVTRSFESLSQAMLEAGRSRIYGGIHFEFANVAGTESGIAIADYVFTNFAQPIPAPGAALLVLLGTVYLLRWRRAIR